MTVIGANATYASHRSPSVGSTETKSSAFSVWTPSSTNRRTAASRNRCVRKIAGSAPSDVASPMMTLTAVHVPRLISNAARVGIDPLAELFPQRPGDQQDQSHLVAKRRTDTHCSRRLRALEWRQKMDVSNSANSGRGPEKWMSRTPDADRFNHPLQSCVDTSERQRSRFV